MMLTYRDVINAWPSLDAFAEDVGVAVNTAKQMRTRNSIPPEYWPDAVAKGRARQILIDLEMLVRIRVERQRHE